MDEINKLPVLILAYNRFEKFNRCVNNLYKQGIKEIFVSIDGPLNFEDLRQQNMIFQFCKNNTLKLNLNINYLEKNYGCRIGPLKGITWFFEKNQFGVVLEDDVIVSKKCMELFLKLLKKILKAQNICQFLHFMNLLIKILSQFILCPFGEVGAGLHGLINGISIWIFLSKIKNYSLWQIYKLIPSELRSVEIANMIKLCHLNLFDAWDYEFNLSHIVNNYSSLTIGGINNYVYGFDESATHTIDKESIGVDFNLFSERKIDENTIKKLSYKEASLLLNKCGFQYKTKQNRFFRLKSFVKAELYSILIFLRIFKRRYQKILQNKYY